MKKIIPILLVFVFAVWLGCGGDEPNGNIVIPDKRLVVNTAPSEPGVVNANSAVWDNITALDLTVKAGGALPKIPAKLTEVTKTVSVQALVYNNDLYMRFQWEDTSLSVWKDYYFVFDNSGFVEFKRQIPDLAGEDQLFVMFDDTANGWDVWNWRVYTTGQVGLAEGMNYSLLDSITPDAAGTKNDKPAWENYPLTSSGGHTPEFGHKDTSTFTDYLLTLNDARDRHDTLFVDTFILEIDPVTGDTTYDYIPRFWWQTLGWTLNQRLPGWMINTDFGTYTDAERGSQWDIKSVYDFDHTNGIYTIVLKRALNTGYADDFDMSAMDSIKTRIVVLNDLQELYKGGTWRGTSEVVWLIF